MKGKKWGAALLGAVLAFSLVLFAACSGGEESIAATKVTLDQTAVSLMVGETVQLNATVEPENSTDSVSWTTSDNAVATVSDSGLVTAIAGGQATITASAGSAKEECTVTVAEVSSAWDGESATAADDLHKDDTAKTEKIGSPADLAGYAAAVNEGKLADYTVTLTDDIDLGGKEWTPVGHGDGSDYTYAFKGVFDGDGHTISGLKIADTQDNDVAFFGAVENAAVKDVTLSGVSVTGTAWAGALIMWAGGDTSVSGVTVTGSVSAGSVGAIVAYAFNDGDFAADYSDCPTVTIENCVNEASLTGTGSKAAGMIGQAHFANLTVKNCTNKGTIVCNNDDGEANAAGIAGYVMRLYNSVFENCSNEGSITAISGGANTSGNAGGIIANQHEGTAVYKNVSNTGDISAQGVAQDNHIAAAGGIIGRASKAHTVEKATIAAKISVSRGEYAADYEGTYVNIYAGGFAGHVAASAASTYQDVTVSGTIEAVAGGIDSADSLAGKVLGYFGNNTSATFTNLDVEGVTSANEYDVAGYYYRRENLRATITGATAPDYSA